MSAEDYLRSIIKAQGPLSVAQFMAIALSDKKYGYYTTKKPLGAKGDFITSPEISQIFGELLGLWCVSVWQQMKQPNKISLVEIGPGRGTLMRDLLNGTKNIPNFHDSLSVHLVDISPTLKKEQQHALSSFSSNIKIEWHSHFNEIPEAPTIIIGNEFFDALPIHQFVKIADGWREIMLSVNENDSLDFFLSPAETTSCALIPKEDKSMPINSIVEVCPTAVSIIDEVSRHLRNNMGAAIFVDYGYDKCPGQNSLQAVKDHAYQNILDNIGNADLTSHVNFRMLNKTATETGARAYGPISQKHLLDTLGIDIRANILMKNASQEQKQDIISSVERLTDPLQMGELFKCIAITDTSIAAPIGFENANLPRT